MATWNPWRGCHRYSEGCRNCYIHQGDLKRHIDTNIIEKTARFDAPIKRKQSGEYQMPGNQLVYLCFSSDFLLEDADPYREACWQMIKTRSDLHFLFLTKRIERLASCLPDDWQDGYPNVTIGCTVENQAAVQARLPIFLQAPIQHKIITAQPLLEAIDLLPYLHGIEQVVVGGEYGKAARPLHYQWVLDIRQQCQKKHVDFQFRQYGSYTIKDNIMQHVHYRDLSRLAKQEQIDLKFSK